MFKNLHVCVSKHIECGSAAYIESHEVRYIESSQEDISIKNDIPPHGTFGGSICPSGSIYACGVRDIAYAI